MTSNDYDVLNLDKLDQNPYWVHGPTVLFSNRVKKFYSCSACRDQKLCFFFTPAMKKTKVFQKIN